MMPGSTTIVRIGGWVTRCDLWDGDRCRAPYIAMPPYAAINPRCPVDDYDYLRALWYYYDYDHECKTFCYASTGSSWYGHCSKASGSSSSSHVWTYPYSPASSCTSRQFVDISIFGDVQSWSLDKVSFRRKGGFAIIQCDWLLGAML